ncbi:hypothetical protein I7I48_00401 [Histoplasma ohiense]|nr:hypothetical protein I7I48_00401 [Histoplasma ohiense (nom. inval.)]
MDNEGLGIKASLVDGVFGTCEIVNVWSVRVTVIGIIHQVTNNKEKKRKEKKRKKKVKENKIIVSLILNPSLWAQQKVREGIVKSWVM